MTQKTWSGSKVGVSVCLVCSSLEFLMRLKTKRRKSVSSWLSNPCVTSNRAFVFYDTCFQTTTLLSVEQSSAFQSVFIQVAAKASMARSQRTERVKTRLLIISAAADFLRVCAIRFFHDPPMTFDTFPINGTNHTVTDRPTGLTAASSSYMYYSMPVLRGP